ncbi:MAG: dephospho-CoA kinase [Malacoplasma sp.]
MQNLSEIKKSNLICITGTMGSGKTTAMNYLKDKGYKTFVMDDYIKEIYKKGNIGYAKILKNFGSNFVNDVEVNRNKLLEHILESNDNKNKLDSIIVPLIEKKIKNLSNNNLLFIELGIYIYFPYIFSHYFQKIIIIERLKDLREKDNFFSLNKSIKFSTKDVGNSKNVLFSSVIYGDYIVENNGDLASLNKKIENILLNLSL